MQHFAPPHSHVVSVDDMDKAWIDEIFALTSRIKTTFLCGPDSPEWKNFSTRLQNRMLFTLFYEPSTRTRFSFETAMQYLGGMVTTTEAARMFSSAAKGEKLCDTIHTCARYGIGRSAIVLRHHERGSAQEAASLEVCPIINAGDGDGEHPTQALLDMFTILEQFSDQTRKTLTLAGDLKNGRTVHSLIKLAIKMGMVGHFQLVAPQGLELPQEYLNDITQAGLGYVTADELNPEIVMQSDVIYMTRTQKERMVLGWLRKVATKLHILPQRTGAIYALTPRLAEHLKSSAMIMHPLPRNEELPVELDHLPQARYFDQVENGLYVRMALLLHIFGM